MEGRYFVVTRSGGFRAPLREARFWNGLGYKLVDTGTSHRR